MTGWRVPWEDQWADCVDSIRQCELQLVFSSFFNHLPISLEENVRDTEID